MEEHSINSSYRERLIEHLFVGELLKLSWRNKDFSLEVSKPEVDNSGYDLIIEANGQLSLLQNYWRLGRERFPLAPIQRISTISSAIGARTG